MGGSSKGKGGSSVTVGYRYYMTLHIGIGRGPIDALLQISADGKNIYKGALSGRSTVRINKPSLFGGDKGEGGIVGPLTLLDGAADQVVGSVPGGATAGTGFFRTSKPPSSSPLKIFGSVIPGFRGTSTIIYDGLVSAMNPYIKPWKIKVRRVLKGWYGGNVWYPTKARIELAGGQIHAMNPAHIIYQCLTDPDWGGGFASSRIHSGSFQAAADTLHTEGFGLCIRWSRQESVAEFIQRVIDHIGGSFYQSRFDGLFYLKLLRDDYDPETLPLFDEDNGLLSIDEDESGAQSGATNEVVVTWADPLKGGNARTTRERNLAAIQADGQIISTALDYSGLPTEELARRVAVRELTSRSSSLRRFKIKLDRRGWQLEPGAPFRIRSTRRGIQNLVVRAGRIEDGTLDKAELTITAVQDVFGMPSTSMSVPQPPLWQAPTTNANQVTLIRPFELSWRDLALGIGLAELERVPATAGFLAVCAKAPNEAHRNYQLQTRIGGQQWQVATSSSFTPYFELLEPVQPTDTMLIIKTPSPESLSNLQPNDALLINDEIIRIDELEYDEDSEQVMLTAGRGCADTVPQSHPVNSVIWLIDDSVALDHTEHSKNTSVELRLISRTGSDELDPELAGIHSFQISARHQKPYPPGNIKINNQIAFVATEIVGDVVLNWAHRDRLLQAERLIEHSADSIGPEPGTTYTARLLRASNNSVLASETGITGTAVTLETTYEGEVIVELWAVRDGLESWQKYQYRLMHTNPVAGP